MFLNCKNEMFLSCIKHKQTNSKFLSKGTNIFCLKTRAEILFNCQLFLICWSLILFPFCCVIQNYYASFSFDFRDDFGKNFNLFYVLSSIPLFHYFIRILRLLQSNSARYRKLESIKFVSWAPLYVLQHRLCCPLHFSHCVYLVFHSFFYFSKILLFLLDVANSQPLYLNLY